LSGEDKKDKSFSFDIVNLDVGEPEDLRDGTGNGIRAVISFVITSYYLIKFNSPYLFVDELYSQISKAYVDGFFEFVHKLCDEHGLVFVLITHDERFLNYADQVVQVSEGRVTIHNDLNIDKIEQLVKDVERYNNEEKVTK
jgi:ABC-type lipoprotein export system ATPase subunit